MHAPMQWHPCTHGVKSILLFSDIYTLMQWHACTHAVKSILLFSYMYAPMQWRTCSDPVTRTSPWSDQNVTIQWHKRHHAVKCMHPCSDTNVTMQWNGCTNAVTRMLPCSATHAPMHVTMKVSMLPCSDTDAPVQCHPCSYACHHQVKHAPMLTFHAPMKKHTCSHAVLSNKASLLCESHAQKFYEICDGKVRPFNILSTGDGFLLKPLDFIKNFPPFSGRPAWRIRTLDILSLFHLGTVL